MPAFILHLADGDRLAVQAGDPGAARAHAARQRPGVSVTKVKIDRTVHAAGPKGRLSMAPRPTR